MTYLKYHILMLFLIMVSVAAVSNSFFIVLITEVGFLICVGLAIIAFYSIVNGIIGLVKFYKGD